MSRLTFVVEADGTIRDSEDHVIREEHHEVTVPGVEAVPQAVLDIVRAYWPEATASDISWAADPLTWDGARRLHWSTCAEIDGLVRTAQPGAMRNFDELLAAIDGDTLSEGSGDGHAVDPTIPAELVAYVQSICRREWVTEQVLELAAATVLRRIRHDSPAARRARWSKRWRPEEQARTQRLLGRLRDEVLSTHHVGEVAEHTTFTRAPAFLAGVRPDKAGRLVIDDPQIVTPSIGIPSYLEQTPPKLLAWIRETWLRERLGRLPDEVALDERLEPRIWDLTAGSGTATDFFGRIYCSAIIGSDIVIGPEGVQLADCRDVGTLDEHRGIGGRPWRMPGKVVREPDIILFDPPSRGQPNHSELYQGSRPQLDLGSCSRAEWLIAIAFTVAEGVRHLAPGGVLSLLLRCGSRNHGEVQDDTEALEDLKLILGSRVRITHEMPLVFGKRRNQVSLGQARVPAVHLRIEAP